MNNEQIQEKIDIALSKEEIEKVVAALKDSMPQISLINGGMMAMNRVCNNLIERASSGVDNETKKFLLQQASEIINSSNSTVVAMGPLVKNIGYFLEMLSKALKNAE